MEIFKKVYLCDGLGCEAKCELKYTHCKHTTDANHARIKGEHSFKLLGDTYFELDPHENSSQEEVR